MQNKFVQFTLHPQVVQAVEEAGYTTPTPIQSAVIPLMLAGRDVIAQAQTGTGKTAAFALPLIHQAVQDARGVQSLIVTPTRELALQVARAFEVYGRFRPLRVLAVYGGMPYLRQVSALKKGVDIVVGTPGRLLDLMRQNILKLDRVRSIVLDEADEMLSMGFVEDIESILANIPQKRQMALFSATLPAEIRRLAQRYMQSPESVTIGGQQPTAAAIEQRCYLVNNRDKLAALTRIFEMEDISAALIFSRTRLTTAELANALTTRGFAAEALSGGLSQDAREGVLKRFRNHQIKVLVATDVAARGLDIDDISHVFNYDLPEDPEIYVHRVGRTGRAGKTGVAVSLTTPGEQGRFRRIEAYTRQKIRREVLPSAEDIQARREEQLMAQLTVWLQRGRCQRERELVDSLVALGHEPAQIAAVALKLNRASEKQRPIEAVAAVTEAKTPQHARAVVRPINRKGAASPTRTHEPGMVRLRLNTGHANGTRVHHVVGSLAYYADIPGSSIGKILIQQQDTLVDVPEQFVGRVEAQNGSYRIGRQLVTARRA